MEIRINGKTADITPDSEKTVGEIMASLEQWLAASGHRLSGLSIDGQTADVSLLEENFSREIDTVKLIEIYTSSLADLTAESLLNILADVEEYESLKFEEKNNFLDSWKDRAEAVFAAEQMPDLYSIIVNSFSGGDINPRMLYSITEERLREVNNPGAELAKLQPLLEETCTRLEDLSLDVQTGKDARAAQTIQIFSGITEKILRITGQLDIQGYLSQKANDERPFKEIISEFGNLVKELLEAYERQDTILVGDLAEYEISPRLQELYTAVIKNSLQPAAAQEKNDRY
jgi:hypothetical protein